jgi:hypothetical protein
MRCAALVSLTPGKTKYNANGTIHGTICSGNAFGKMAFSNDERVVKFIFDLVNFFDDR